MTAVAGGPHACLLGLQPCVFMHTWQHLDMQGVSMCLSFTMQRARTSCPPLLCARAGWRGCLGCASGTPGAGRVALGVLVCSRPPTVSSAGPQGAPPQAGGSGMAIGAKRVATGSKYAVPVSAVCGGMRSGATYPTCPGQRAERPACHQIARPAGMRCLHLCMHGMHSRGVLPLNRTDNLSEHGIPSAKSQTRWLMAAPCRCWRGHWRQLTPHALHGIRPGMFVLSGCHQPSKAQQCVRACCVLAPAWIVCTRWACSAWCCCYVHAGWLLIVCACPRCTFTQVKQHACTVCSADDMQVPTCMQTTRAPYHTRHSRSLNNVLESGMSLASLVWQ